MALQRTATMRENTTVCTRTYCARTAQVRDCHYLFYAVATAPASKAFHAEVGRRDKEGARKNRSSSERRGDRAKLRKSNLFAVHVCKISLKQATLPSSHAPSGTVVLRLRLRAAPAARRAGRSLTRRVSDALRDGDNSACDAPRNASRGPFANRFANDRAACEITTHHVAHLPTELQTTELPVRLQPVRSQSSHIERSAQKKNFLQPN